MKEKLPVYVEPDEVPPVTTKLVDPLLATVPTNVKVPPITVDSPEPTTGSY